MEAVKAKVEVLVASCLTGHPADDEVSRWLAKLDTVMLEKLSAVGLVARRASATVGKFLDDYMAGRIDVKPATREVWSQPVRNLKAFFGTNRPLRDVTAGDAENFRLYLIGEKLAPTTVHKRLQFVRSSSCAACRHKLITETRSPMSGRARRPIRDRQRFVTLEEARKLLETCPNRYWRVIVSLSRFGGLRCPSEVLSLTWQDIDWEKERITVHSPKTEHHPGKDIRIIPLFPELRPILEEAFEASPRRGGLRGQREAPQSSAWARPAGGIATSAPPFCRIIRRAGLTVWDRPFHNMRSSRVTELAQRFPIQVVTAWLGNTPEIARRHYLQVTDEHFRQATAPSRPCTRAAATVRNPW